MKKFVNGAKEINISIDKPMISAIIIICLCEQEKVFLWH